MAEALYRKYRPRSLDDVVGQQHIVETLKKALKTGRIRHAYLFSGPKGVGKTSIARILAHEINQLPYTDDAVHLDIIEIDAASNRRIDEIRDLRDKVNITPAAAKYKVYIIDEVHMLTREAFNALLKTLEEPPEHSIFILATTEAHKLPETIISRTQHFTFKPIDSEQSAKQLEAIAKKEKINITPEALWLIAEYEHGSLRDGQSLLDRLGASGTKVTDETVRQLIGLAPDAAVEQLSELISAGSSADLMKALDELSVHGSSPGIIAKQMADHVRQQLVTGDSAAWKIPLLRELIGVPGSVDPRQSLEIALLEAAEVNLAVKPAEPLEPAEVIDAVEPAPEQTQDIVEEVLEPEGRESKTNSTSKSEFSLDDWPKILAKTQKTQPGLYSALRLAIPEIREGKLLLKFEFALHQKKLASSDSVSELAKIIASVSGISPMIESVLEKSSSKKASDNKVGSKSELGNISNIFDGAEVLES